MKDGLGLNGATLPRSDLLTGITSAAVAGFSFYEPRMPELEQVRKTNGEAGARRALEDAAIGWLPLNALEGAFATSDDELKDAARSIFSAATPFGIRELIVVPGPVPRAVDPSEAVSLLKQLKSLAEASGFSLLYEFIGFSHHAFPSLGEARTVASAAGLLLVLDTFHLAASRTPQTAIESLKAGEIGLVHLSDAYIRTDDVTRIADMDRVLPGEGQLPLARILESVLNTGYSGPISVEVFHPKYGDLPPEDVAREAYVRATDLLTQVHDHRSLRRSTEQEETTI